MLACTQSLEAVAGLVAALGVGEGVHLPGEEGESLLDRLGEDRGAPETRQVEVVSEVLGQLAQGHRVAAPERDAVELMAEAGRPEGDQQQLGIAQLAGGTDGGQLAALEADLLPLEGAVGIGHAGHEEPGVGFRQAHVDRLVVLADLGARLLPLELVEVEAHLVLVDRSPGEVEADRALELGEAGLIGCEKSEGVAVLARAGAARLEDRRGLRRRGAPPVVRDVGVVGVEHHQPGLGLVGDLGW